MNKTIKTKKVKALQKTPTPKIWIILSLVLVVILVGAVMFDQLYKRVILTIDGDNYHMNDLSYYFYTVESQYDYYDQMFGGAYWDMTYDKASGATIRDNAKQEAVDASLYTEILYREARSENYTLTAEETEKIKTDVTSLYETKLSKAVIEKNVFTKKYLTDVLSKSTLVNRYRQDQIDSLEIDDEEIKAGIDFEEYKQYDIEYFFISTQSTDAEGKSVAMSEQDKTAAYDKMNALYETAKTTEDWSTLIPEGEEALNYQEDSFLANETTFSDELKAMMMSMGNESISEVYEAENGYYVVRMLNNNSSESYNNAVAKAISDVENEGFSEIYQDLMGKYDYTVNDKALEALTMGNLTLAK